jgi:hypothetical protein
MKTRAWLYRRPEKALKWPWEEFGRENCATLRWLPAFSRFVTALAKNSQEPTREPADGGAKATPLRRKPHGPCRQIIRMD